MKNNVIRNVAALITLVIVFSSCAKEVDLSPTRPVPGNGGQEPTVTIIENKINKDSLLLLVNETRAKGCNCGGTQMPAVGAIAWNELLEFAAVSHSKDMSDNSYFSHNSRNGDTPGKRLDAVGYRWNAYAENIAKGPKNAAEVIAGWIKSPEHCKNLMNGSMKEMGVGRYNEYWTQAFGVINTK
ncbi:CAP domain-containing protein [Chitinophaga horti]|uniref:CAP domain-containing protein n=1 Tax=Chitinophaga horti TaxID=2920382 RepID=A0ABY6J3N8_9BACT|nr:CAP domain-containing protein [Chitinophaga horti]UYQ92799.1 CAP domain-containing protein [Chitinophaga horti]